jgi:dienelactone hydrolase
MSAPFPVRGLAALALSGLAAVAIAPPSTLGAQQAPRTAVYLILKGDDTLVVERVRRTTGAVTAMIFARNQPSIELGFTLAPDHRIPAATLIVRGANASPDTPPLQSGQLRFVGDSVFMELLGGGASRNLRLGTRAGAIPISNNDFVTAEQFARIAMARGVRTLTLPVFTTSGGVTLDATLERVGADSARFTIANNVTHVRLDAAGNVVGGAIPAQGLRIVVVEGPAANAIALGKPDYGPPAGAPYTAEEITVPTPAGHVLAGTLTKPTNASGRLPAVVTITGSGAQDRDEYIQVAGGLRIFRQVADTLSRRGIAVLRLDDRGVGGSGGDPFGTSADFADDIRAAVAYLRSRPDIDGDRIALVGHSEGGLIAPMVARTDPRLAAIVLMAGPAYTGRAIIDYQIRNGILGDTSIAPAARDSVERSARAQFDSTSGKLAWMRFFLDYDPIPTAKAVKQPVLILQGATDQQVRAEEAPLLERAFKDGGNRNVTMLVLTDRNHLFLRDANGHPSGYAKLTQNKVDGEVLGALAEWLITTLRAR